MHIHKYETILHKTDLLRSKNNTFIMQSKLTFLEFFQRHQFGSPEQLFKGCGLALTHIPTWKQQNNKTKQNFIDYKYK